MKKKIVYLILAVLTLGLFATSCAKTDFLEGTVWTCHDPDSSDPDDIWTITFINKVECSIFGDGYLHGGYSGEKNNITIDWDMDDFPLMKGTIKGDVMKLQWEGEEEVYTFKKKK